jgi:AhpD family alkylhydroperoxidase
VVPVKGERPDHARIQPVDRVVQRMREAAEPGQPVGVVHLVATLSHLRPLRDAIAAMSVAFADVSLDPRTRELITLRTAWDAQCAYLWAHHAANATRFAISDDDLLKLTEHVEAGDWSRLEAAALRMIDDLHQDNCVTEEVWNELAIVLNEQQMLALVGQAAFLRMASNLENSLGIQAEEGLPPLPGV